MHDLPGVGFTTEHRRDARGYGSHVVASAYLRLVALDLERVSKLRRCAPRYTVEGDRSSVRVVRRSPRCCPLDRRPASLRRAKRVSDGHVVAAGVQCVQRARVAAHERVERSVVFLDCRGEIVRQGRTRASGHGSDNIALAARSLRSCRALAAVARPAEHHELVVALGASPRRRLPKRPCGAGSAPMRRRCVLLAAS